MEGHKITLLTIVESSGNERALTAAGIQGVSDLVLAYPSCPDRGLAWIEAFDNIDLIELAKMAKANRKAVPKREAMAANAVRAPGTDLWSSAEASQV